MGNDGKLARENRDLPSIYLPMTQELLLKEIYKVNPRIALILQTGNPLTSQWAAEHVPSILQAWYPGQEGGGSFGWYFVWFGKSIWKVANDYL